MNPDRTLPWDWYPGTIPANAVIDPTAYVETTFTFYRFCSQRPDALRVGRGAGIYQSTLLDCGVNARIEIGEYVLLNGARIICDAEVTIGNYTMISWNVVLMDTFRSSLSIPERRRELELMSQRLPCPAAPAPSARPIRLGNNVWIGFGVCILPGVTIGEGAIVGARSMVNADVPPYTLAAGNPARVVRELH